jgi:hypothetical protein
MDSVRAPAGLTVITMDSVTGCLGTIPSSALSGQCLNIHYSITLVCDLVYDLQKRLEVGEERPEMPFLMFSMGLNISQLAREPCMRST